MYYSRQDDTAVLTRIIKDEIKREIMEELCSRQGPCLEGADISRKRLAEEIRQLDRARNWQDITGSLHESLGEDVLLEKPHAAHLPVGATLSRWVEESTGEGGREILYGIGTVALLGILLPSLGKKIGTVFSRTALEGMDLIEKARSVVARAKEDVEDLIAETSLKELMKRPRQ